MKRALTTLALLTAFGCADSTGASKDPAPAQQEPAQEPIVSVSTKDHIIQFFSSEVVTLKDHSGKVLETQIPMAQFRADYPDLVDYLDNAIAEQDADSEGPELDASVDPHQHDQDSPLLNE